ncbi:MAG: hypothetical protein KKF00_07330 [Proteobacteria bacterium]|nr:hypothetical protein [Pseudomonadota bacterium]
MNINIITEEISNKLQEMSNEQHQQVLEFVRSLVNSKQTGVSGKTLLSFAGKIPPGELELMKQAIEEGCEKVNTNEW